MTPLSTIKRSSKYLYVKCMELIRKNDTLKVESHAHGAYAPQPANHSAKSVVCIGDSTKDVRGTGDDDRHYNC